MAEKFKNNVNATLASSITAASTTIALSSGDGAQFPVIASGTANVFRISLWDKSGNVEIISICRRESGSDTLYVGTSTSHQSSGNVAGRGMESTTALAITSSDYHVIKMSVTAAQMEDAVKFSSLGDLTATVTEINATCDGNTATAAELSELHSGGAVNADFVKLHAIASDAAEIDAICNITAKPLNGDSTTGRVLRLSHIKIQDGTTSSRIKITLTSVWNGDAVAALDNVQKGYDGTNYALDSNGFYLTIKNAAITGDPLAVLATTITAGHIYSGGYIVTPSVDVSTNTIRIVLYLNGNQDMTAYFDSYSTIELDILYLTSA
jgi:hypothetical protein